MYQAVLDGRSLLAEMSRAERRTRRGIDGGSTMSLSTDSSRGDQVRITIYTVALINFAICELVISATPCYLVQHWPSMLPSPIMTILLFPDYVICALIALH